MDERLSTGNGIVDRHLAGGIPPGKLVALVAPPESQAELLLYDWIRAGEGTFLSTIRPADELQADLESVGAATDTTVHHHEPAAFRDDPESVLETIPEHGYFVVDYANAIESFPDEDQRAILTDIKRRLRGQDAIGLLHCVDGGGEAGEGRALTLKRADVVWKLHLAVTSLSIDNRLLITKFRGGRALTEPIKLKLTDAVRVDTSRDIA